jgi:hypothetical protein
VSENVVIPRSNTYTVVSEKWCYTDHALVLFQLDYGIEFVSYPFKFNLVLLKEESFGELVREEWSTKHDSSGEGAQIRLLGKLFRLKARVKKWIATKKKINLQILEKIEEEVAFLTKVSLEHQNFVESNPRLKVLETERNRLV